MSRRISIALLCIPALAALSYGAVFGVSENRLRDVERPPAFMSLAEADSATVAHGKHITRTRGCFGCHGQQLEGRVFDEWDWVDRAVAPNLARVARELDDAALEAAIRHGIGRDGRALWSMPSYNFAHLSDEDLSAMIAFLRSAPIVENDLPKPRLGLQARWWIVTGEEDHMAQWVMDVPALRTNLSDSLLKRGEYIAMTTCNECHGLDLRGDWLSGTPDLAVIAGYTEPAFRRLMKEGISMAGREDIPLMSMVARDRFANFTDEELVALRAFLSSLIDEPVPQDVSWR